MDHENQFGSLAFLTRCCHTRVSIVDPRTDLELLLAYVRCKEQGAFTELVIRYDTELRGRARGLFVRYRRADLAHLDGDAAQEAFLRLHRYAGTLVGNQQFPSLRGWLCDALRSATIDLIRRNKHQSSELTIDPAGANLFGISADIGAALEHCLAELRARDREVIELLYWLGLTVDEIAEQLGTSAASIYRRRSQALESLLTCVRGQQRDSDHGGPQ